MDLVLGVWEVDAFGSSGFNPGHPETSCVIATINGLVGNSMFPTGNSYPVVFLVIAIVDEVNVSEYTCLAFAPPKSQTPSPNPKPWTLNLNPYKPHDPYDSYNPYSNPGFLPYHQSAVLTGDCSPLSLAVAGHHFQCIALLLASGSWSEEAFYWGLRFRG